MTLPLSRSCWLICSLFSRKRARKRSFSIWTRPTTLCTAGREGRFFHGYYDCYCYLPLYVFCGDQLLVAKLRKADIDASAGAANEIARVISAPNARLLAQSSHHSSRRFRFRARGADGRRRS